MPVRIRYDTPDGKMRLFCRVNVIYGEPMPAAQFAMESRRDMKVLRANKQALLDAWEQLKVRTSPSPSVTPPLVGRARKQQLLPYGGAAERMRG